MKLHSEKRTIDRMKKPAGVLSSVENSSTRVKATVTGVLELTPLFTVVRIIMDIFQHRHYRLCKISMSLIGLWPYQSTCARRGFLAVFISTFITGSIPQVLAHLKYHDDWRIILDGLVPCLFATVCAVKFIGVLTNSEKTLKLLNHICTNWRVRAEEREIHILHEYAEKGEKMTIVFTAAIYSTVILFTTQPMIPKIIDVMLKNGTELGKFPYPVDFYFFDAQNFYYYIMIHFYICACIVAIPLVASDSMLIICVQYVCGVFAAVGYKLEQIGNDGTSVKKGENTFALEKRSFVHLASLINRHNDAIEYVTLLDATYTWTFFFTIGLGMVMINLLGLQILMRSNDPESTIRFVAMVLSLEMLFYTECYISQILEDHSMNISYYIHNSRWYRISPRAQRFLQLMMVRCHVPCQLTAWKMSVISLRTFGAATRTAISYFAFVRSMDNGFNDA